MEWRCSDAYVESLKAEEKFWNPKFTQKQMPINNPDNWTSDEINTILEEATLAIKKLHAENQRLYAANKELRIRNTLLEDALKEVNDHDY